MKPGAFDGQGLGATDKGRLMGKLGVVEPDTLEQVEAAVRKWLAL